MTDARTYPEDGPSNMAGIGIRLVGHGRWKSAWERRASTAGTSAGAGPETVTVATKAVPGAGAEGQSYVGETKCLECHAEQLKGYEGSPHHRVADPRSPAAKQGCESCHGPGSKHVDDPAAYPVKNRFQIAARSDQ